MSEGDIKRIEEQYKEHIVRRGITEPSKRDQEIVATFREVKSLSKAARVLGISQHKLTSAIARVAAFSDRI